MTPNGTQRPIRVLIADDSATVRAWLIQVLERADGIEVVGAATNGREAVALARSLAPDVVTMDVHMPELDGLEATREIMIRCPTPIVVVSATVDAQNVEATLRVLETGAVAAIARPTDSHGANELVRTLRLMADVKVVRRKPAQVAPRRPVHRPVAVPAGDVRAIGIAASTGGPSAIFRTLQLLPTTVETPILVVQHMSPGFLDGFVAWLSTATSRHVTVAAPGARLQPNTVYVAPDDAHLGLGLNGTLRLSPKAPIGGFRPSASFLFESLALHLGPRAIGVILTGMGEDGVAGLSALHAMGGVVIAQDEATSAVWGMPAAAIRAAVADHELALDAIPSALADLCRTRRGPP